MFRIRRTEARALLQADHAFGEILREEKEIPWEFRKLVLYNRETYGAVLTWNNQLEIFTDGETLFTDMRNALRKAEAFIHIQSYIIKDDEVFDSMTEILKEKVRQGVEVRILCDGMGSRSISARQWKKLKAAGIQAGIFFPAFLGRFHLRMNYRNHRKIVVIDGHTGYVGGFNMGKEYIGKDLKFGYWRDTHLKLVGDGAVSLQLSFALDWEYAVGENLFERKQYFNGKEGVRPKEGVGIQIIAGGPDSESLRIRDNYLLLFYGARDHIYIQTPYFIPDEAVLTALKTAIRTGVDVRLMIPCKPDHLFVYQATCSYMGELLQAGARCYVYENGFLHGKVATADAKAACCGTANMDIRSFRLNFEINTVIFDEDAVKQLEESFLYDITHCKKLTAEEYGKRSRWVKRRERWSRLLSPIL